MAGGLNVRECVLRNILRASERSRDEGFNAPAPVIQSAAVRDIRLYSRQLGGFYQMRAARQQDFMDGGAGITQFAGLGALLSEGAGANTQLIWLQVAFAPVLASQFNAHEPTRDLYFAGSLGLELISMRYTQLEDRAAAFVHFDSASPNAACEPFSDALVTIGSLPKDDKDALQSEAQRLITACIALRAEAEDMRLVARGAQAVRSQWGSSYASDIIRLDRVLEHKDHQVRFSPAESLGAILASPFRTAGALLSGQSETDALKTLETSIAFEGMAMSLEPVRLPERRSLVAVVTPLADTAVARRAATTSANARRAINTLQDNASALVQVQRANAHRYALLSDLYAAAASTELKFDYSVSNRVVTVTLAPPPPPTPAQNTQTTAPGGSRTAN
jgi:hypothetical protein